MLNISNYFMFTIARLLSTIARMAHGLKTNQSQNLTSHVWTVLNLRSSHGLTVPLVHSAYIFFCVMRKIFQFFQTFSVKTMHCQRCPAFLKLEAPSFWILAIHWGPVLEGYPILKIHMNTLQLVIELAS